MEKNQQSKVELPPVTNNRVGNGRRYFLWGGLLAMLGGLRAGKQAAAATADNPVFIRTIIPAVSMREQAWNWTAWARFAYVTAKGVLSL